MDDPDFRDIVRGILAETRISALMKDRGAVVLERMARGGGATTWYGCAGATCVETLSRQLSPGSVVSFYFDDRFLKAVYHGDIAGTLELSLKTSGELLIGLPRSRGEILDVEIISGPNELKAYLSGLAQGQLIYYGAFPARDNDGVKAVTVSLPDRDGVVRGHPH